MPWQNKGDGILSSLLMCAAKAVLEEHDSPHRERCELKPFQDCSKDWFSIAAPTGSLTQSSLRPCPGTTPSSTAVPTTQHVDVPMPIQNQHGSRPNLLAVRQWILKTSAWKVYAVGGHLKLVGLHRVGPSAYSLWVYAWTPLVLPWLRYALHLK